MLAIGLVGSNFSEPLRWAIIACLPLVSRLDPRHLTPPFRWVALIWLGYASLTLLWTPDRLTGAYDLSHLILLMGIVIAAAELNTIEPVMTALGLGVAISAPIAIAQIFGMTLIPQFTVPAGLFYNRDLYAEAAAPVLIWALISKRWLLAIPLAVPIVICDSRVAIISFMAGMFYGLPDRRARRAIAVVAIVLIAATPFASPEKLASLHNRLDIWRATATAITPFGHGIGWFKAAFPFFDVAHSDILQMIAELGAIPMFGLMLWGLSNVARTRFSGWRNAWWHIRRFDRSTSDVRQRRDASTLSRHAARAALAGALTQTLIAFPLHAPVSGFVLAMLVGDLVRRRDQLCRSDDGSAVASVPTDRAKSADAARHRFG